MLFREFVTTDLRHSRTRSSAAGGAGHEADVRSQDRVEVHPPGFSGDLHGNTLEVEFLAKLREERRFAGVEELRAAIRAVVEAALALR